jgi:hypothetical protein
MNSRGLLIGAATVAFIVSGCGHVNETESGNASAYSARESAVQTEDLARKLYDNGQASSMNEARSKASAQVNANWATESRRVEKKRAQEKFTKELDKMN